MLFKTIWVFLKVNLTRLAGHSLCISAILSYSMSFAPETSMSFFPPLVLLSFTNICMWQMKCFNNAFVFIFRGSRIRSHITLRSRFSLTLSWPHVPHWDFSDRGCCKSSIRSRLKHCFAIN